jgi:hypothetical protein
MKPVKYGNEIVNKIIEIRTIIAEGKVKIEIGIYDGSSNSEKNND